MKTADTNHPQTGNAGDHTLPGSLSRCLSLDLEADTRTGMITAAAAYRPDTGQSFTAKGPLQPHQLHRLEDMSGGATHLTGHNIAAFDLPILQAVAPLLSVLKLPALDTLKLNPLAFPRHPYHRLVKHYKDGGLVRSTHNDPLLDSQLAIQALTNQYRQFTTETQAGLLTAYHWLTTMDGNAAYDTLFTEARNLARPEDEEALETISAFLWDRGCRQAVESVGETAKEHPWPLAYALAWLDTAGTNSAIPPWVLHNHPQTAELATNLRERNCGSDSCPWCLQHNNPAAELRRWFGFDSFRPEPADGGSSRENLVFDVLRTQPQHKMAHLKDTIERYCPNGTGGVIVYCATRKATSEVSEYLNAHGIISDHFHGSLTPERKKQAQDDFLEGRTKAICATNAFGMGVDKPDVRLVVHADIPGSLENYLQEAGRAGRDRQEAHCVLLYNPDDAERQHALQAGNRLSTKEINALLKSLRKLDDKNNRHLPAGVPKPPVVATTGEILDEDEEAEFDSNERTADTKARTAIAWLEESQLLDRQENQVNVFPSCITVPNLMEARRRIHARLKDDPARAAQLVQLVNRIINAEPDHGISTDNLRDASGMTLQHLRKAMTDLASMGILNDDSPLTAYVHHNTQRSSLQRLERASQTEDALIVMLQEEAPDQQPGETHTLHLRQATQRLKDQGHNTLPVLLLRMLRSLARTGTETQPGNPAMRVRATREETVTVTLNRPWSQIRDSAATRRKAAHAALKHLLSKLPANSRGQDLLAATTTGQLTDALRLHHAVPQSTDPDELLQQSLLWLHDQEIVRLNQGMTIMRPAMTIALADTKRRFTAADYQPLDIHYGQQTLQVHIMAEYAERGLNSIAEALQMALDYFTLPNDIFTARWMSRNPSQLKRRTTPESYRRIVESLNNPAQRAVVTDDRENVNTLLLAGPGSGKTTVLVHRIAYLVRVRRENPRSILALAYNRHAAVQIRERLQRLIGNEADHVTVLTCHALAMRLTGRTYESHSARTESQASTKSSTGCSTKPATTWRAMERLRERRTNS